MKKVIALFVVAFCISFGASAQTMPEKTKTEVSTKVKPKKTVGDRVHNTLHPKRKHYSGVKVKKEVKKEG